MHIAFLTPEYPHEKFSSSAGLGTSIKNLASALVEKGVQVTIIAYDQDSESDFKEEEINFKGIKHRKYKTLGWLLYRKHIERVVNRAVRKYKIDIIEAPDWTGITAFMSLNAPLVLRIHGSDGYFCNLDGRKQKLKNRFFEKKALENADALVSVGRFAAEVTKRVFGLDREIEVIHNGLFFNQFQQGEKNDVFKNRLLYFGTIIRKKGVLELAKIFNLVHKKNPDAELLLIGKDVTDLIENRSTLELFREKLNPEARASVRYLGEVNYEEVKKYIASSEVIVLPSYAEALPMTWLEAMAMEKALVTSNIGWASEVMIDRQTGYTVNPKDHFTYSDRIIELLGNTELAEDMGKAARKRIEEKFSTSVVVSQNIEFYENIIKETSRLR